MDVTLELDTELRLVVVPPDFKTALAHHAAANKFFDGLSCSTKQWFVLGIEGAVSICRLACSTCM